MITIVDYGMGNLRSVSKALEHLGAEVRVSSDPKDLEKTDKLVLPGVGAFGDAIRELEARSLFEPIKKHIQDKKLFLGICLGLQLLFEESEESPGVKGLGVFKGKVQRFRSAGVKIPHMGWNNLKIKSKNRFLNGLQDNSFVYFVHTFYAVPQDPELTLCSTLYGEEEFPAIVGTETAFATQFHPEKSQAAGLQLLRNFIAL